ncbi:MAG: hypothetical protein LBM75_09355 [Myxococcales bacterium]|jgi:hypothetical protein|nr:hypothetical protein [Myxococcales bacterium]
MTARPATRPLDREVQIALTRAAELCERLYGISGESDEIDAVREVIDCLLMTRSPDIAHVRAQRAEISSRLSASSAAILACQPCWDCYAELLKGRQPRIRYVSCAGCRGITYVPMVRAEPGGGAD